jgi:NADH-quinone oxidoreductase subunit F
MYPQILLQNRKPDRIATLAEYRQSGGYEALAKALREFSPKDVQQLVLEANLAGRGGAGFPAGRKWMGVADHAPFPRSIVSNADEMEPGTFKDRVLIHADPHQVIEGMILAGYAVCAERGILFVRPAYGQTAEILEREIEHARAAGFLGKRILGSDFSMDLVVHRSGGRYICGEGTALINAIHGIRPHPRETPPRTTEKGLWGQPTVLNNVETLACVPHIVRNGAQWFKALARSKAGTGTKLYCVSGQVQSPGCYELPMGTPLREIIEGPAAGMRDGRQFKACLPGGASTRFLPREFLDVEMDFDTLRNLGHRLGTGAIVVFHEGTCLVAATLNLTEFFARESCGWCTPCREGLPYIRDLLWRIEKGQGREEFIPMLLRMSDHLWRSYCPLAPGAAQPIESLITYFEEEVREHISQKRCPFGRERGA